MNLQNHQQTFVETYYKSLDPVLLAGCVGSGKTAAAIMLDEQRRSVKPRKNPTLIICPKTLVENWCNEIKLWTGSDDFVVLCNLSPSKRKSTILAIEENPPRWIIANYDTIRIEWAFFQKHHWYHVIVDEAHNIKNRQADRAVAIKGIKAYSRMALTGTPIANKPYDLWSLLHFLQPGDEFFRRGVRYHKSGEWGSFADFCLRYCYIDSWGHFAGSKNLDELNDRLTSNIMVRWRKEDVLQSLPELTVSPVSVEMTSQQRNIYNQLMSGFFSWPDKDNVMTTKAVNNVLAQLTYFRRCTSMSPVSFSRSLAGNNPSFAPNLSIPNSKTGGKLSYIKGLLEYTLDDDEKLVILTNWRDAAFEMLEELEEYSPCLVMGGVDNRQGEVDRFNKGSSRVFIGTSAAFEGLNLQSAHNLVWNDLPWGPKDVTQGNGRIHRLGQKEPCNIFYALAEDSIDSKVFGIIRSKATDVDVAIDGGVGKELLQFPWSDIL